MKKTPLKRKKPIDRKAKWKRLLRKTPLAPVSPYKQAWNKLYNQKKAAEHKFQYCRLCFLNGKINGGHVSQLEAHHPMGRIGERIMHYVFLCRDCHEFIHHNGAEARRMGYLLPEFSGRIRREDHPNPFNMPILK